ncbi:Transcription factor [Dimargaris cristalligena]|nr:Transcription factor [Dimargaris cristalligena]
MNPYANNDPSAMHGQVDYNNHSRPIKREGSHHEECNNSSSGDNCPSLHHHADCRQKRKKVIKAVAPTNPQANLPQNHPTSQVMQNYLQSLLSYPMAFASPQFNDEYSMFANMLQNIDPNATLARTGPPLPALSNQPFLPPNPNGPLRIVSTNNSATPSPGSGARPLSSSPGSTPSHPPTAPVTESTQGESNGTGNGQPPVYTSSPAEIFFQIAADPSDGSSEGRLRQVINAKYEAGLLKPYNYVKGYARLQTYMERYMSTMSQARVLTVLSSFRPAFRSIAQSLTDFDLLVVEEMFERLLLDYDRVFSAMGVPACLWRRTGEIYKANKEFANLIKVPLDQLREGKLSIYELMMDESAVNYWEKYGNISFDATQKAVLTSCILRHPRGLTSKAASNAIASPGAGSMANGNNLAHPHSLLHRSANGNCHGGVPTDPSAIPTTSTVPSSPSSSNVSPSISIPQSPVPPRLSSNPLMFPPQSHQQLALRQEMRNYPPIPCCFSFTIRRDKYNIPLVIVGNFIPVRPK